MFKRLKNCHNTEDFRLLAKQRLPGPVFHYIDGAADDEITYRRNTQAFAATADKFNTYFGISSLATVSIEEIGQHYSAPKMFQLYVHKDKGLTQNMIDRCKAAKFDALSLTGDTIVGGNRERD